MKPLVVIPPAPGYWPALLDLYQEKGQPWLRDIEARVARGVDGGEDAYALVPEGGRVLAGASISKRRDVGLLAHVYTRPEHRRRGYARRLTEALLAWFEMTGGRWLYLGATAELDESLYAKFGFQVLRRAVWAPHDRLTMVRRSPGAPESPYAHVEGPVEVRPLRRADWPALAVLLQYHLGPDPRVPLEESAVGAGTFALDLADFAEDGRSRLLGAWQGPRLVALGSLALDQHAEHTYAIVAPAGQVPDMLREALVAAAKANGYERLDFPMETVDKLPAWAAAGKPPKTPPPAASSPPSGSAAASTGTPGQNTTGDGPAPPAEEKPVVDVEPPPVM